MAVTFLQSYVRDLSGLLGEVEVAEEADQGGPGSSRKASSRVTAP
jgi:hypothetical protein